MMNSPVRGSPEFIDGEKNKVSKAMAQLMNTLNLEFPCKQSLENKIIPPISENYCFVASRKEIYAFKEHGEKSEGWKQEEITSLKHFSNRKRTCLSMLVIDGVKYLAAGYKKAYNRHQPSYTSGIEIVNLGNMEKKTIEMPYIEGSAHGFNSIGLLRCGENDIEQVLLATHSDVGVLKIPLEELVTQEFIDAEQAQKYVLMPSNPNDGSHLRMKIRNNVAYISKDKDVFQLNQTEVKKLFTLPEKVSCIDAVSEQEIYTGTSTGNIYLNNNIFFECNLGLILKLQYVNLFGKKGILFNAYNNCFSVLNFYDGNVNKSISSLEQVIDFYFNGKELLWLNGKGLTILNRNKFENKVNISIEPQSKQKVLCVYSGGS